MKVHAIVVNWPFRFENVQKIEDLLSRLPAVKIVTVLNADPSHVVKRWISVDPSSRFSNQFYKAAKIFLDSDCDVMFFILGDAISKDWEKMVKNAVDCTKDNWGVLAPYIDFSPWADSKFIYNQLSGKFLSNVMCTDGIVFFIDRKIVKWFVDICWYAFKDNFLGWGVDFCICALSWLNGMNVIQDGSCKVVHMIGSGYSKKDAADQMDMTLSILNGSIKRYVDAVFRRDEKEIKLLFGVCL
ncbi:MAG: hypothetical protein HQK96_08280 [Nitrospirae bacterium]|nr:hypothetical protein [Nitrospirota bacterium]